jgi:hypothetical protein
MIPTLPSIGNITLAPAAPAAVAPTTYEIYVGMVNQFVIYEIVAIALLFILLIVGLMFYPYFPWLKRIFIRKKLIGVMKPDGDIVFDDNISIHNDIYYLKDRPLPFVKRYPLEYQLSGVPIDILSLDYNYINHPKYREWEKKMVSEGYTNWKKIDMMLLLNRIPKNKDTEIMLKRIGFSTIEEALTSVNPKGYTEKSPETAPYWQTISIEDIEGYGYKIPQKSLEAEADDRRELEGATKSKKLINTLMLGIGILIVLIGGALAYVMITK